MMNGEVLQSQVVPTELQTGDDVLYFDNIEGGHSGAADNRQAAYMAALGYTFLIKEP
jgi:prolyl oligopeptidase PreP (S9A serine peptidase family)